MSTTILPPPPQEDSMEKRVEKLLKKTKPFFDEKSKPKTRLFALSTFLEAAQGDVLTQQRFFAEHANTVFQVTFDSFWHQVDKLKQLNNKPDKPVALGQKSGDVKEVVDFFKILSVFKSMLLYCRTQIGQGWHKEKMVNMFRILLHHGNHVKLRQEGLRLLLLWLNDQDPKVLAKAMYENVDADLTSMIQLYRDAVWLASFVPSWPWPLPLEISKQDGMGSLLQDAGGQIEQGKIGADQPALLPALDSGNPTANPAVASWKQFQAKEDGIILFEEILYNLVVLAKANAVKNNITALSGTSKSLATPWSVLVVMWSLFLRFYLRLLFPSVCLKLGFNKDSKQGFPTCPPELLKPLLVFLSNASKWGDAVLKLDEVSLGSKGAVEVMQQLLFADDHNKELVHEMVRQSMLLPWRHWEIIGVGINLMREWMFCVNEERPPHLATFSIPGTISTLSYDPKITQSVRRYIRYLRLVFLERQEQTDWPAQHDTFERVINLLRTISTEAWIILDTETWECLMTTLLEIYRQMLMSRQDRQVLFGNLTVADEFAGMLAETVLIVWIRSGTESQVMWEALRSHLSDPNSTRWHRVVQEWSNVMQVLTRNLGLYGFNVDTDNVNKDVLESSGTIVRGNKRVIRNPTPTSSTMGEFTSILRSTFSPKSAAFLWKNMACILGNVNDISFASSQAEAMNCVVNITDMLLEIRATQPFDAPALPPVYDLVPWIFQACDTTEFRGPSLAALGSVCRLMCRRHDQPVPDQYFYQFYRLYILGLSSDDVEVMGTIMSQANRIFNLDLPGSHILIPITLRAIRRVFKLETSDIAPLATPVVPEQLRANAAFMAGSLIGYTNLYQDFIFDAVKLGSGLLTSLCQSMTGVEFKAILRDTLMGAIMDNFGSNRLDERVPSHVALVNALGLFVVEQVSFGYVDSIDAPLNCILSHLTLLNARILHAAVDCLSVFPQNWQVLKLPDVQLKNVVERMIQAIDENLNDGFGPGEMIRALIVAILLHALENWLMCVPSEWFKDQLLTQPLFDMLDSALSGATPSPASSSGTPNMGRIKSSKSLESPKRLISQESLGEENPSTVMIANAAENTLMLLLHLVNHFPSPDGSTVLDTMAQDPMYVEGGRALYFGYNQHTILTLMELPGNKCRVICRDVTGRYAWDMGSFSEISIGKGKGVVMQARLDKLEPGEGVTLEQVQIPLPKPPVADPLEALLLEVCQENPDLPKVPGLNAPTPAMEELSPLTSEEVQLVPKKAASLASPLPLPRQQPLTMNAWLQEMGFLNYDALKDDDYFHLLQPSQAFFRDVKGLDKRPARETCKVALLYVGPGQEDEITILKNDKNMGGSSKEYEAFVTSLGWQVDLVNHQGYMGGLDRDGNRAIYYCNATTEIMFHEVTRMPYDETDAKQLKKKRHIGNDTVHIVWNEHHRHYKKTTISGDFANVQIIVTPMTNGLYAVDVFRDQRLATLGPLQAHCVVNGKALSGLVRATCLAAHRHMLAGSMGKDVYRTAYAQRAHDISVINGRHRVKNWSLESFLEAMLGE